jgi:glutamate-1-semialdehyde 2,1-aminomutase
MTATANKQNLSPNDQAWQYAQTLMPGGVNSPVRALSNLGRTPFFTVKAAECYLYDANGKQYVDLVCGWGANIVGHNNRQLVDAIHSAAQRGITYGTPSMVEIQLAEQIKSIFPSIQKLRLTTSGTEATMTAIRIARGYTQRPYIVKFAGCYHGHADSLLVDAGSGMLTNNIITSDGLVADNSKYTLVVDYNDCTAVEQLFAHHGHEIAAIIVEPYAGNMNMIIPKHDFLLLLRQITSKHGSLLIFDEVMTGCRVALGGAQSLVNITPDLTTLGKIIGGGMPLAAVGGNATIMNHIAPLGKIYHAGTHSGNPLAAAAAIATLDIVSQDGFYTQLQAASNKLMNGMQACATKHKIAFCTNSAGGMFGFYFASTPPQNLPQAQQMNAALFGEFFRLMLDSGIFISPSMFESGFISMAHNDAIIEHIVDISDSVFWQLSHDID